MYIQRFYPELCTISRSILLLFISLFFTADTWALSTDKDQPIEIEADYADLDNEKGVTIYRGNVVLTQGTVRMTGDTMTVYFKDGDLDTLIMEGKPARYRQLPDDSKIYDEAEALRMEYYSYRQGLFQTGRVKFQW